jgi:hypothetical protein
MSLGPATCGRSGRPQLHRGYARRNVHARLRLHGHRLQGDCAVRAADKDVGTRPGADRAAGGRTRIGSRQRSLTQRGRRKNGPSQPAAGRGADVEAKRAGGALISLARPASRRCSVSIPVAVSVFPGEQYQAPRSWTGRAYPRLIYCNKVEKGGHFAAWEQPQLFAQEVRAGFRPLRKST